MTTNTITYESVWSTKSHLNINIAISKIIFFDYYLYFEQIDDETILASNSLDKLSEWVNGDMSLSVESFCFQVPHYSISVRDAWRLIDRISDKVQVYIYNHGTEWVAKLDMYDRYIQVKEKEVSMAISKAFLLYHNVESIEIIV